MKLRTGPCDDLEHLCNLLIYLSNNYEVLDLEYPPQIRNDLDNKLSFLQEYKKSYSLSRICQIMSKSDNKLYAFCKEVSSLSYGNIPNYAKLRQILHNLIVYEKN